MTPEALEPYRFAAPERDSLLPYLRPAGFLYDITMEIRLNGELTARTHTRDLFWTFEQMIAHHTSNGCNLRRGDLLGSGTISGSEMGSFGSLLEDGRGYLQDGDEVVLTAFAERPGLPRIGFGECRGVIRQE